MRSGCRAAPSGYQSYFKHSEVVTNMWSGLCWHLGCYYLATTSLCDSGPGDMISLRPEDFITQKPPADWGGGTSEQGQAQPVLAWITQCLRSETLWDGICWYQQPQSYLPSP